MTPSFSRVQFRPGGKTRSELPVLVTFDPTCKGTASHLQVHGANSDLSQLPIEGNSRDSLAGLLLYSSDASKVSGTVVTITVDDGAGTASLQVTLS